MKLSENAIQRLRDVQAVIRAEPRRLRMDNWMLTEAFWGKQRSFMPGGIEFPPCGTVGCIAGWLVLLNEGAEKTTREYANQELADSGGAYVARKAARLLGLAEDQQDYCIVYDDLFLMKNTRYDFRHYSICSNAEGRAELVCKHIDWFIEQHS